MAERTTEQVPRGGRRSGFHMRPKHVGLVSCVSLVGCMVAFGAGFLVGMGYKASEQVSPYVVKKPLTAESSSQNASGTAWEEKPYEVTFYDTLIKNKTVDMIPAADTAQAPKPTPAAPAPARLLAEEMALQPPDPPTAAIEAAQPPSFPPPAAPAPAPASPPALQEQAVVAERTGLETQPLDLTDAAVASYSVQVASVLTPEQAERLIEELTRKGHHAYIHPFAAPGQPLWYRVKVGKFTNRATAELTLQELRSRETPNAFITRN